MASPPPLSLGLTLVILTVANALQVTPGSSCSSVCEGSSSTKSSDIVCNDFDYYSSAAGSTFMKCIECLQTSNATSDSENDVSWFLYNLRYASAVCLYDFPTHNNTNSTSSCDLEYACAPLRGGLEYGNLDPANETQYGYCQADNNAFYGTGIDDCVSCLASSPSTYTANFLLALEAGCQQEPTPGSRLSITGSLFSTAAINITVPSNTTVSTSSSSNDTRVLSLTAIIGIVVGLGVLFLLAGGLFTLHCCRQRRYAREDAQFLNNPYGPSHASHLYYTKENGPTSFSTGQSYAMPHYTVDYLTAKHPFGNDSPLEHQQPSAAANDFSSNAEYYDRLEGRSRGRPLQPHPLKLHAVGAIAPIETDSSGSLLPTNALPTHPAYIPRSTTLGHLGGRASRNASRSASTRSSAQSMRQNQSQNQNLGRTLSKSSSTEPMQPQKSTQKPTSYAMEVFLDGREDAPEIMRAPSRAENTGVRNIHVQLGRPMEGYEQQQQEQQGQQQGLSVPPPVVSWKSRRASVSPQPPPDRAATATPAMSSLILPSVPKIRVPGKKPPKLRVTDPTGVDRDGGSGGGGSGGGGSGGGHIDISGPLAFPDGRFSVRPANDRIIEQTVDRSGHIEVPIGSGKSYLYG